MLADVNLELKKWLQVVANGCKWSQMVASLIWHPPPTYVKIPSEVMEEIVIEKERDANLAKPNVLKDHRFFCSIGIFHRAPFLMFTTLSLHTVNIVTLFW